MNAFYPWNGAYPLWSTFRVLPTVYEQAMSYEEQILFIANSIEKVLQQIDSDNTELYNYINEQIASVKSYADGLSDNAYVNLSNAISALTVLIQSTDQLNRAWTIGQLADLKNLIGESADNVIVRNPFNGYFQTIQTVLDDIVHNLGDGLTAIEFDSLGLTAGEFDGKRLTAYQFDIYGKRYLMPDSNNMMFNPWTGDVTSAINVISELVQLHKEYAITAGNFDILPLNAMGIDGKDLTSYQFDFNAEILLREE